MLAVGSRLGPYEVIAPLGAGGMGEVYRARDTRLERTVAIKILADALTGDPELRQRLFSEARAISQLSHPHICTLHDIGDHQGTTFLVMEFLDGETLADRIAHHGDGQPALSVSQVLEIGVQIGEALAMAHRQGIVHRDLKPGNVMLARAPGTRKASTHAKLLDFGLAKTRTPIATAGATALPTTPPHAVTAQGAILGTFHYMAPEQLEGGEADSRSDIFAFGCVLFEMLTARKAFDGKSPAAIMASILEREPPPVTSLRGDVPALVDDIVRRCLAKNPDERWQSISDVVVALRWAAEAAAKLAPALDAAVPPPASAVAARWRSAGRARVRKILVLFLGGAVAGAAIMSSIDTQRALPAEPTTRFEVLPPTGGSWSPAPVSSTMQLALSPDGQRLAFVASVAGSPSQIWLRALDAVQAQPLPGTEGASFPFWSPDGRSLGFFADRKLKTISAAGGSPQTLCDAAAGRGATWGEDDVILFTPAPNGGIQRVPAGGGAVTTVTTLSANHIAHYWPQFLPGGRRFLFYAWSEGVRSDAQGIYVGTLDSSEITRVLPTDGMARYVPGHLLFTREGTLVAQPVDDRTLLPRGDAQRVADLVGQFAGAAGFAGFTAAANGTLAYGPSVIVTTRLVWRDREGAVLRGPIIEGALRSPRLSPDQKSVVVTYMDPRSTTTDIWVVDPSRGTFSRLTTDARVDWLPIWSPDGGTVFFSTTRGGSSNIYRRKFGETSVDEAVTAQAGNGKYATDVTPDGALLAVQAIGKGGYDLQFYDLHRKAEMHPFLVTPFNEVQARVSPDGKWIAFSSDESGVFQIYVRQVTGQGGQSPISIDGGMQPEWRRDGKELFYLSAKGELMSVPITADADGFSAGLTKTLFKADVPEASAPYPNDYAVSADGRRFLINTIAEPSAQRAVTIVMNWASALNASK
jgi:serine/threonine protein kinase